MSVTVYYEGVILYNDIILTYIVPTCRNFIMDALKWTYKCRNVLLIKILICTLENNAFIQRYIS